LKLILKALKCGHGIIMVKDLGDVRYYGNKEYYLHAKVQI